MPPLICPSCGREACRKNTPYGRRDNCRSCGLWSWHGKPLVPAHVHEARKHCHAVVDPLWKRAVDVYQIEEAPGTPERAGAEKRIRKSARSRVYKWLAYMTGLPEPECHMGDQDDIAKLRLIYKAANGATAETVRTWWKNGGAGWWHKRKAEHRAAKTRRDAA